MKQEPMSESEMHDDLQPEYSFAYHQARPNRFVASAPSEEKLIVVLDPDVAQVFTTPEAVNDILRALIQHMPSQQKNVA